MLDKPIDKEKLYLCILLILLGAYTLFLAAAYTNSPIILGVLANIILLFLLIFVCKLKKVHLSAFEVIICVSFISIWFIYYIYSLKTRNFIYYSDYGNYYNRQLEYETVFQTGFFNGIKYIQNSIMNEDYTCFINIFVEPFFGFTNRTGNAFVASCAILIIPFLYFCITIWLHLLISKYKILRRRSFFVLSFSFASCFPLMHRSLIWGQPDLFGLIFVFLIMITLLGYDFTEINYKIMASVLVITAMLLITRRWYMYWIVSFFCSYAAIILMRQMVIRQWEKARIIFTHLLFYGVFCVSVLFLLFWPMFSRILGFNYSKSYSEYMLGGFKGELLNQAEYIGILTIIILLFAAAMSIIRRQCRAFCLLACMSAFINILLFTRVQNMGYCQSLIMVPCYILLGVVACFVIVSLNKKSVFITGFIVLTSCIYFNLFMNMGGKASNSKLVSDAYLQVRNREDDIEQIKKINYWIKENCDNGDNTVYMIPHGYPYNPDMFRNIGLPDTTIKEILPYGQAVLGAQPFPIRLLSAKYVLTCEPFCNFSIAYKYNEAFYENLSNDNYKLIETFDMGNGYTFFVYERIIKASMQEVEYYRDYFSEENEQFPNFYDEVFDKFIQENDLGE